MCCKYWNKLCKLQSSVKITLVFISVRFTLTYVLSPKPEPPENRECGFLMFIYPE